MRSKQIVEEFETFNFAFPENRIMRFIERISIKRDILKIDGIIEIEDIGSHLRIETFQLSPENFLRMSARLSRFELRGRHTLRDVMGGREQFTRLFREHELPECPF